MAGNSRHRQRDCDIASVTLTGNKNSLAIRILIISFIAQLVIPSCLVLASKPKKTIKQKLLQDQIIPDVIDDIPESANVTVEFPSGAKVHYGNELTPTQVKDMPKLNWSAKDDELYMVAVLGPDAMTRADAEFRSILYWLVSNIPGKNMSEGETFAEYIGVAPPQGSGIHRYVYLVYAQKDHVIHSKLDLKNNSIGGRVKFSIREFAGQHHSKPIAANYFFAKYDDYVPVLQKQLTGKSLAES